jgi:hypothetical protein
MSELLRLRWGNSLSFCNHDSAKEEAVRVSHLVVLEVAALLAPKAQRLAPASAQRRFLRGSKSHHNGDIRKRVTGEVSMIARNAQKL